MEVEAWVRKGGRRWRAVADGGVCGESDEMERAC